MATEKTASYNVTEVHIVKTPGICGGKPRLAGRRIKVQNVYIWHEQMGMSAKEIAEQYNLTLGQVYAALTYAYDHLEEIEADIREDDAFVEEFMKRNPSILKPRLDELGVGYEEAVSNKDE